MWFCAGALVCALACDGLAQSAFVPVEGCQTDVAHLIEEVLPLAVAGDGEAQAEVIRSLSADSPTSVKQQILERLARTNEPLPEDELADAVLAMLPALTPELESDWARVLGRYELERVIGSLTKLAENEKAPLEQRRLAILALCQRRTQETARTLMGLTTEDRPLRVQGWAFDALGKMTHQPGLQRDRVAWDNWYEAARRMRLVEWEHMLHDNLLALIGEREVRDAAVRDRLIQSQRALYRATAPELRPALLIEMLSDPLDAVRILGMDLARQRAEDNGEFGPELRSRLLVTLDDPLPSLREASATLLGQLLDSDAADVMAQRLSENREQDGAVRQAYLLALTQLPRRGALVPAYDMLTRPSLQPSAAGMLAAAYGAGLGEKTFWEEVRDRTRDQLDGVDSPKSQMITLLGLMITEDDDSDWSRIADWLDAEDDRVRESAARAWALSKNPLVELAERSDDPVIRPIALKAIAERGNREATLKAIAQRRPTEPEDIRLWEPAMIALAGRIEPASLLKIVGQLAEKDGETRQVREQMLTAGIERANKPDEPTRDDARLLVARAQTRVLEDAPALVVLDYEAALLLTDKMSSEQIRSVERGLARAYLADRRHDDAIKLITSVLRPDGDLKRGAVDDPLVQTLIETALEAIEQGRKADAAKILAGVRTLLSGSISDEMNTNLRKLEERAKPDPALPASPVPAPAPAPITPAG